MVGIMDFLNLEFETAKIAQTEVTKVIDPQKMSSGGDS